MKILFGNGSKWNVDTSVEEPLRGTTLTYETLQQIIEEFFPVLYYATTRFTERGHVYLAKETELYPEFLVVHPEDLEELKSKVKWRTLVHISKYEVDWTKLMKPLFIE